MMSLTLNRDYKCNALCCAKSCISAYVVQWSLIHLFKTSSAAQQHGEIKITLSAEVLANRKVENYEIYYLVFGQMGDQILWM